MSGGGSQEGDCFVLGGGYKYLRRKVRSYININVTFDPAAQNLLLIIGALYSGIQKKFLDQELYIETLQYSPASERIPIFAPVAVWVSQGGNSVKSTIIIIIIIIGTLQEPFRNPTGTIQKLYRNSTAQSTRSLQKPVLYLHNATSLPLF